jgi:predicted ATP-grasp superfamily ATP-dependent carboligase
LTRPSESVLIAGVSVRGLTESAARAGYRVTAVDAFSDLDLQAVATDVRRVIPYSAAAAADASRDVEADAVCYVSNFENYPAALRRLQRGRTLLGNPPRVLARARDPAALAEVVGAAGLPAALVRNRSPRHVSGSAVTRWLLKPRASGGGHGIVPWSPGIAVPRSCVLQQRLPGRAASVLFAADGERAIVLGVTRQLIGERRFGSRGFRYCGSLLAPPEDPDWGASSPLAESGTLLAAVLTRAFGLVGVNGVDVMVHRGQVIPIEINPRHTAAMELLERRDGLSIFHTHVAACTGELSALIKPASVSAAAGKAIVFARRDVVTPSAGRWLADSDVRDVPASGTRVRKGAPICTVFAIAKTVKECFAQLARRAERIYEEL